MSSDSHPNPGSTPEKASPDQQGPEKLHESPYSPEYSIRTVHGAVLREAKEPEEGKEPLPLWLSLFFALLIFVMGGYLLRYSGGFDSMVYDGDAITYGPVKGGGPAKAVDPVVVGKRLYSQNCASCHQATGQGAPGQYPPLAGSEIVLCKGGYGENHLARIMLDGLAGPVHVSGALFNGNMPAWSSNLKDEQIASILTYLRQEWGNQAGPIATEGITAARKELESHPNMWTEDELKKLPPAALPAPAKAAAGTPPSPAPAVVPAPTTPK